MVVVVVRMEEEIEEEVVVEMVERVERAVA